MYEQPHPPPQNVAETQGNAWLGFGLSLLLHLFQIPIAILILIIYNKGEEQMYVIFPPMFIGVSQLIYQVPAIIIAAVYKKYHLVKGLLIGAAIVFLLNAACTGLFYFSL
jgi:hypothetical protein